MKIPRFLREAPFDVDNDPSQIAIAGSNGEITYAELFHKVEEYLLLFRNAGLKPGNPLFIYGHKEKEIPALMLAALEYGLPYIPVDPAFPEGRIKSMWEACGGGCMVMVGSVEPLNLDIPCINLQESMNHRPELPAMPDLHQKFKEPLAYVLFTSGTTGNPKGVCISIKNLRSFITWLKSDYPYRKGEVMFNHALFTFDVSLYDVFAALLTGGTMVLNSRELLNSPPAAMERIRKYQCTTWTSTPALAYMYLMQENFHSRELPSVRNFIFAGEPLPSRTISRLQERFPGCGIYNAYGPTEATVTTTLVKMTPDILQKYSVVPVGYQKPPASVFVDDSGALSEVIIFGEHVSPGYLNRADLNDSRFFEHQGMRAYRTGDRGYFEDELLFVSGRIDEQIKFNGYRIEPAEIEAVLLELLPDHAAVAVLPLRNAQEVRRIIALIHLPQGLDKKESADLRALLEMQLPSYMIPSEFCYFDEWAWNNNGKTDKAVLLRRYLDAQQ